VHRRQTDVSRSLTVIASPAAMSPDDTGPETTSDDGHTAMSRPRLPRASRLLEAEDIAAYLGMRTDWVYREVRAGRLPHIRLGRAVRFRLESIDAWLESRERGVSTRQRP
jgi:excisionase family DNA binding protein